ncbi:MAG: type IV pilin protein [Candidatus Methylomirabilales bacterium]
MGTPPGRQKALRSLWCSLSGFTLVELLIAIAVLVVIVLIGVPYYNGMIARAQEAAALSYMTQWPTAQALFYTDNRRFATSLDQLHAGAYLPPANSAKIGYNFEITDLTAQAPSQDQPMLASASYRPDDPWWQRLGLVKLAWADDNDDEDEAEEEDKDDEDEDEDEDKDKGEGDDDNQGGDEGQPAAPSSSSGGTLSGGGFGWEGYADPIDARQRHFYIDQTKTIRFAKGRRAHRYDPLVEDKIRTGGDSDSGSKNSGPGSQNSGSGKPGGVDDLPPTSQGQNQIY